MHLPTRRRNRRKLVFILLISVLSLLAVLNFSVAWYLSGVLKDRALEVREYKLEYNLTASAFGQDLVRVENGPDRGAWRRPGKWGLSWDTGSGMIGDIVEDGGNFLVRQFTIGDGDPPSSTPAFVSGSIYPNDPFLAFRIEYAKVQYETPLGSQDAWRFEGEDDTWAIFVHGHRGTPGDGLPSLPVLHDLGLPALYITYRNDKGQPRDPSGFYQFGLTEWQDLHAAVGYVLSQPGARNVVLIGHSMGGSIIAKFPLRITVGRLGDRCCFRLAHDGLQSACGPRSSQIPSAWFLGRYGEMDNHASVRLGLGGHGLPAECRPARRAYPADSRKERHLCAYRDKQQAGRTPSRSCNVQCLSERHSYQFMERRLRSLRAGTQTVSPKGHKVTRVRIQAFGSSHAARHNQCHGPGI